MSEYHDVERMIGCEYAKGDLAQPRSLVRRAIRPTGMSATPRQGRPPIRVQHAKRPDCPPVAQHAAEDALLRAAVLDDTDTVESHVEDTLVAGGGLCKEEAVRFTVEQSREAIQWLIEQGVPFTRDEKHGGEDSGFEFHLTREGGHSHRRIVHVADATGLATNVTGRSVTVLPVTLALITASITFWVLTVRRRWLLTALKQIERSEAAA